ncbi:MAG: hypothetical protein SOZ01_02490 [Selenomonadaceae bacterium]|nr:hypothetical protein [Selenomonadaceae bacterium]MDY3915601.1 hypothetical protein [Selenomonadaceae bacterium]
MSAFLAPIHFWMFDKIKAQDELTGRLAQAAVTKGWLSEEDAKPFLHEEEAPLEELIGDDIHGCLSSLIDAAEERYAKLAGRLLNGHEERLDELKQIAKAFGQSRAAAADSSAEASYQAINDVLLDGMPCDGVNIVTDKAPEHFSWERRFDVHGDHWAESGRPAGDYYQLRLQVMAGILAETPYAVSTSDYQNYTLVQQG